MKIHNSTSSGGTTTTVNILSFVQLNERLVEYEQAGWITDKQYMHYNKILIESQKLEETEKKKQQQVQVQGEDNNNTKIRNDEAMLYREQITYDLQKIANDNLQQVLFKATRKIGATTTGTGNSSSTSTGSGYQNKKVQRLLLQQLTVPASSSTQDKKECVSQTQNITSSTTTTTGSTSKSMSNSSSSSNEPNAIIQLISTDSADDSTSSVNDHRMNRGINTHPTSKKWTTTATSSTASMQNNNANNKNNNSAMKHRMSTGSIDNGKKYFHLNDNVVFIDDHHHHQVAGTAAPSEDSFATSTTSYDFYKRNVSQRNLRQNTTTTTTTTTTSRPPTVVNKATASLSPTNVKTKTAMTKSILLQRHQPNFYSKQQQPQSKSQLLDHNNHNHSNHSSSIAKNVKWIDQTNVTTKRPILSPKKIIQVYDHHHHHNTNNESENDEQNNIIILHDDNNHPSIHRTHYNNNNNNNNENTDLPSPVSIINCLSSSTCSRSPANSSSAASTNLTPCHSNSTSTSSSNSNSYHRENLYNTNHHNNVKNIIDSASKTPLRSNKSGVAVTVGGTNGPTNGSLTKSGMDSLQYTILNPTDYIQMTTAYGNNDCKENASPQNINSREQQQQQQQQESAVQNVKILFVEMCFYARMGFVQPPCCLHCTYKQSIALKKAKVSQQREPIHQQLSNDSTPPVGVVALGGDKGNECCRYVIWRIEASSNVPIRPDTIQNNLLIIQCHTVQQLLNGETVSVPNTNNNDSTKNNNKMDHPTTTQYTHYKWNEKERRISIIETAGTKSF